MKLSDSEILELHDLFDGLVENNLSIVQKERLQFLLENSEVARSHYVRFLDMSSSLKYFAEESLSNDVGDEILDRSSQSKIVSFFVPVMGFAALLVIGFYLFYSYSGNSEDSLEEISDIHLNSGDSNPITPENTVAVLTRSVGLKWSDQTGFRPGDGSTLEASALELSEGLVQVEFLKGATVILEGPVNFEILNQNEGSLKVGKLRASVPKVARGFTVALPKGEIIDLGTEFGLHVHDGGASEIFVYRGEVLYKGITDSGEELVRQISGGEALFVDPYGFANWVEMPSEAFIGTADLAFRSREKSQLRHEQWVQLSEEITQNPDALLYFNFDNHSPWARMLTNRIDDPLKSQAAIIGCKWEQGRWPGKGALSFVKKNDMVRMDFHENLDKLTLSCWVKVEEFKNRISPLFYSETESAGATSWYIDAKGRVVLEIINGEKKDSYFSAVAFRKEKVGRWMHVATTFDSGSKMVSHFVNGRPFSREKILNETSVKCSTAFLGHVRNKGKVGKRHTLHGSIDELAVFKISMSDSEIRRMYEIGSPYEVANLLGPKIP